MNKKFLITTPRAVLILVLLLAGQTFVTHPAQATTYTVINTNDSGGGSLRWAIETATINPAPHIIDFNIP